MVEREVVAEVHKTEMEVHRIRSVKWNPTAVLALATSVDGSHVAAARADGSLEIWLVPPGSVGWHCQLIIHGDPKPVDPITGEPNSRVSSLVWCQSEPRDGNLGRLFSSNIDGSIVEWDLYNLREKCFYLVKLLEDAMHIGSQRKRPLFIIIRTVLDSSGISIWQIAAEPCKDLKLNSKEEKNSYENSHASPSNTSDIDEEETSESEDDDSSRITFQVHDQHDDNTRLALACGDGCVRIYSVSDDEKLTYNRTLPRVSGRMLSVTWSSVRNRIYSGSSDGFIRSWDVGLGHEIYRITVGHGGLGSGSELCIWSLLALRCGTILSGDSSGRVQFWDSQFGTLLQAHAYHKGHVNALATSPSQSRVFSAGSDGKVILYNRASETVASTDGNLVSESKKWIYVGAVGSHTHDVLALTLAVPISHEDFPSDEKVKRMRGPKKPLSFSYHKWAHLGVPMLISGGEDTKLFAYSVNEFTKFHPHDICPAPQRLPMQLVPKSLIDGTPLLLVQGADRLDIYHVHLKNGADASPGSSGGFASTVVERGCEASRKIICSTISSSGTSFAYSDHVKPYLYERKRSKLREGSVRVRKRRLPHELPFAHFMIFTSDSSRLLLAGHDQRIYVLDVGSAEIVHTFTPCRNDGFENLPPSEPPITKMMTSADGQWLAAVNCFGDVYVFNLETLRQHWFLSRLDGASVTAGGFTPQNGNILIICTSSNQVYALDVEAKQLGEWSMRNTLSLPKRYQEFPGEVIGLSFQPASTSSSVIVYSTRATCFIDFGMPIDKDDKTDMANGLGSIRKKLQSNGVLKRKRHELEKHGGGKNFELCLSKHPILFVEHLSDNSLLVVDKPWSRVVNAIDTKPVHRQIYGT